MSLVKRLSPYSVNVRPEMRFRMLINILNLHARYALTDRVEARNFVPTSR